MNDGQCSYEKEYLSLDFVPLPPRYYGPPCDGGLCPHYSPDSSPNLCLSWTARMSPRRALAAAPSASNILAFNFPLVSLPQG